MKTYELGTALRTRAPFTTVMHTTRQIGLAAAVTLLLVLPGCFSAKTVAAGAGTGEGSLLLEHVSWGRLVDILDEEGVLVQEDVVVNPGLASDGFNYRLFQNPVTNTESLRILHPVGTPQFDSYLATAQSGLSPINAKGLLSPPTFSMVGRNAAIKLQFSELLDPGSVNSQTVQVMAGSPPDQSHAVRRIVTSEVGAGGLVKGVVILDTTLNEDDQQTYGLPQNLVGLPESNNSTDPNVIIRIPTALSVAFGQTQILTNAAGTEGLTQTASDPVEYDYYGKPVVVRAFRSGNQVDSGNGFLPDSQKPSIIAELAANVLSLTDLGGSSLITYTISDAICSGIAPKIGDVFEIGGAVYQVTKVVLQQPGGNQVEATRLSGVDPSGFPQIARLTTKYSSADSALQLCYVSFQPPPMVTPGSPSTIELDPYTTATVKFDEPIDRETVRTFDSFVLSFFDYDSTVQSVDQWFGDQAGYDQEGTMGGDILFGPVEVSADSRSFSVAPAAGISDPFAAPADWWLNIGVRDGLGGVLDLAGNPLDSTGFVAGNSSQDIVLTCANPTSAKYFSMRADGTDEVLKRGVNGPRTPDGSPEYAGQYALDPNAPGVLHSRALQRYSRVADPNNQYIGLRTAFGQGIMTPLTPAGAVLMTLYRDIDLGFGLGNTNEYNLDIESLNWSPFAGQIYDFVFNRYSLALAHSNRYPDETINPTSGYPAYKESGLRRDSEFDNNILGFAEGLKDEVFVFDTGATTATQYIITPLKAFQASTGSSMYPWPDFDTTYTWRDTSFPRTLVGGDSGSGAPPAITGVTSGGVLYAAGDVPSVASPLLMRFRCYPQANEYGANGFQVQIMVNSSALPAFRVFSAGGLAQGGWDQVTPDDPNSRGTVPTGGYNTTTLQKTSSFGPEVYWGQVDFVVKVSRIWTHFFSLGGVIAPGGVSAEVFEPSWMIDPTGTSEPRVVVEYRGADSVTDSSVDVPGPLKTALVFDPYADYSPDLPDEGANTGSVGILTEWTEELTDLIDNTSQYFQVRMTFIANADQDVEAYMDAFGFAWSN